MAASKKAISKICEPPTAEDWITITHNIFNMEKFFINSSTDNQNYFIKYGQNGKL